MNVISYLFVSYFVPGVQWKHSRLENGWSDATSEFSDCCQFVLGTYNSTVGKQEYYSCKRMFQMSVICLNCGIKIERQ